MRYAIIEGAAVGSMARLHRLLAEQLDFPDWYGGNLDALYDCLTELTDTAVVFVDLRRAEGTYFDKVLQVFWEAAEGNPCLTILNVFSE